MILHECNLQVLKPMISMIRITFQAVVFSYACRVDENHCYFCYFPFMCRIILWTWWYGHVQSHISQYWVDRNEMPKLRPLFCNILKACSECDPNIEWWALKFGRLAFYYVSGLLPQNISWNYLHDQNCVLQLLSRVDLALQFTCICNTFHLLQVLCYKPSS